MNWCSRLQGAWARSGMGGGRRVRSDRPRLGPERLDDRVVPTVSFAGGTLSIVGTLGDDEIRIYQDGSGGVTVDDNGTPFGVGGVARIDVSTLNGNDRVHLESLPYAMQVGIDTGKEDDVVYVGDGTGGYNLGWLAGCFVEVRGGLGFDALKVFDSGYHGPETYHVTGQDVTVAGLPGLDVFYGGGEVEYLSLSAGDGDNHIRVYGVAPGMSAWLWAGGGNDTLWGPNVDSTWVLTGPGTGTLNGAVGFGGVENLAGGSGDDTFFFGPASDGAGVAGWIDAGAGWDTLNYTGYGAPYSAVIPGGPATGTGAGAWNIEFVV